MFRPPPEPVANPNNDWADLYAKWFEDRSPEYREWERMQARALALEEALRDAEPFVEMAHSLSREGDGRKHVFRLLKRIRAALTQTKGET
ncbi:hypothetical protein [uncultured Roseobacter sp.]|uniref:hypothetical protein n=1 Tax=uncultured Roseobacter sp. TaxID=114847 RepID=UPI002622683C|nr:hypothetical protein [uncultured Roseobacter sp.]